MDEKGIGSCIDLGYAGNDDTGYNGTGSNREVDHVCGGSLYVHDFWKWYYQCVFLKEIRCEGTEG